MLHDSAVQGFQGYNQQYSGDLEVLKIKPWQENTTQVP